MAVSSRSRTTTATVTTAGTRVQLSTGTRRVKRLYYKPRRQNLDYVFLGGSDVSSTVGLSISPWERDEWKVLDFSPGTESEDFFYIDALANGEGIEYWMVVEK